MSRRFGKPRMISGGKVYEVRCCCVPQKLLGWMSGVPEGIRRLHAVILEDFTIENIKTKTVEMPLERFRTENGDEYFAFKAEGITVDELCRLPGFLPNPEIPLKDMKVKL